MSKDKTSNFSDVNKDATYAGAIRSTMGSVTDGALIIKNGANQLLKSTGDSLHQHRVETFDMAMERLGISPSELPLIHNQIVSQIYVSFFVAVISIAIGMKHIVLGDQLVSGILAIVIALTAATFAIQSSVQTYQIRQKKLNLLSEWFSNSSEWFPSRMDGLQMMEVKDPLRAVGVINGLRSRARFFMIISGLFLAGSVSALILASNEFLNTWAVLLFVISFVFLMSGARNSFEVYRRCIGVHCDLGAWLLSPSDWFPSKDKEIVEIKQSHFSSVAEESPENSELV